MTLLGTHSQIHHICYHRDLQIPEAPRSILKSNRFTRFKSTNFYFIIIYPFQLIIISSLPKIKKKLKIRFHPTWVHHLSCLRHNATLHLRTPQTDPHPYVPNSSLEESDRQGVASSTPSNVESSQRPSHWMMSE